jgi:hypothetical protein
LRPLYFILLTIALLTGFEGPFPESITAELVPSTAANLTGKIVLMPVVLPYSTFLPGLQQAGAVACLVQTVFGE